MKMKAWTLLGLASLVLVGAIGMAAQKQATASLRSASSNPSAQALPNGSIAQMMNATKPSIISSGSFVAGEQPTQGTARIIAQNGKLFLELGQGFKTSSAGPDLVVLLHRSSNVLGLYQTTRLSIESWRLRPTGTVAKI